MGDTTSLTRQKAVRRAAARAQRRALPPAERKHAAEAAARHLARACRRWHARSIAVFLSMAEEIDTRPLLAALLRQGCRLYVPRLERGELRFAPLHGRLRRNRHGIAEPVARRRPLRLDVIVMPLVAFDAAGRRLGMGGGYYDRFLARLAGRRRPLRVGFAFAAQQLAAVPAGDGDARLDAIVTEHGFRRFR